MNIFGEKLLICAKQNSIDHDVWDYLEDLGVRLKLARRDEKKTIEYYDIQHKVVLIDIGGYFSSIQKMDYKSTLQTLMVYSILCSRLLEIR